MKKIIHQFASAPRLFKQIFLIFLDAFAFPVILWLCYVIRLFDLGADVIPGIDHGIVLVSLITVLCLALTGVYHFIVRTFNEVFIVKLAIAVSLTMIALYILNVLTPAYIPMSIPFMYGFMVFAWVWISRAIIRFIIKASFYSEIGRKRIAIYGAGDAGQQIAAA